MQNYFLYMLTRCEDPKYLRYLSGPVDQEALASCGNDKRRLWSTPLLLHIGGIACEHTEFVPIRLSCGEGGHVSWTKAAPGETDKHIMHIVGCDRDTPDSFDTSGSYKAEMVDKLCTLLGAI